MKRILCAGFLLVCLCQCVPPSQSPDAAWTDPATGLTWHKQGCRSFRESFGGPDSLTLFFAKSWISALNNKKAGGYNDWRLPSIAEYRTIFKAGAGQAVSEYRSANPMPLYTLGYLSPIEGKRRYAWSRDGDDQEAFCFDFVLGEKGSYPKNLDITYEFEALAVRGASDSGEGGAK